MAARPGESVLRRGRAKMEPGRRALADAALLQQVAGMIGDAEDRRLTTVGAVSISQLAGEWMAGE